MSRYEPSRPLDFGKPPTAPRWQRHTASQTKGEKLAELLRQARGVDGARRAVFSRTESELRR